MSDDFVAEQYAEVMAWDDEGRCYHLAAMVPARTNFKKWELENGTIVILPNGHILQNPRPEGDDGERFNEQRIESSRVAQENES